MVRRDQPKIKKTFVAFATLIKIFIYLANIVFWFIYHSMNFLVSILQQNILCEHLANFCKQCLNNISLYYVKVVNKKKRRLLHEEN